MGDEATRDEADIRWRLINETKPTPERIAKLRTDADREITQLRTERDEARADTERLDWIAQPLSEFAFPVRDHSTGEWWIYHDDDDQFTVSAPTLREAIDKAGKVVADKQREEG